MLRQTFDRSKPYRYVQYGRMSSDQQNPRSPEQQFDSIGQVIRRQGGPWIHVGEYRDDGRSGRFMRKRPGFQAMLRDIRTGMIKADLILVDTLERFGRNEEIPPLRRDLYQKYGILVLTADSGFADPLSVPGQALSFVENIRATEDTRVKAHNVLRGKKDLILHKRGWPGGRPPLGFRLESVMKTGASGNSELDFSKLIRDPAADWIVERIFQKAAETGWGTTRLARFFNADLTIPEHYKPFQSCTVGYILDNPLYKGELVWNEHATGIVNDTRVLQANPQEEWLRVPDFCPAIVSAVVWDNVQVLRQKRRQQIVGSRQRAAAANGKQLAASAPGLALKYPLSGLVRCHECGAAMRPSPSKRISKNGEVWRRTYYVCPRYIDRTCPNGQYLPEDSLRDTVIARLRARLFPAPGSKGQMPDWFPRLVDQVQQELRRQAEQHPDERTAWEREAKELQDRLQGWSQSLANPQLDPQLRADIEGSYGRTKARIAQLRSFAAQQDGKEQRLRSVFDPRQVLDRLQRLSDVLTGANPTQGNLELSQHIDRIDCFADGRVVLRSTPLGIFEGSVQLLRRAGDVLNGAADRSVSAIPVKPRRRAQLRVEESVPGTESTDRALDITDPERFRDLDACWFWEDALEIPRRRSWAEEHANEVAQLRSTMTMEQLAAHFSKTVPTIRNALQKATQAGGAVATLPKKLPRPSWAAQHAANVQAMKQQGKSILAIAKHFSKSDTTIRAALRLASPA